MSKLTAGEIVSLVEGVFEGERSQLIEGVKPLADASERDLSFLSSPKYEHLLESTRAAAILVSESFAAHSPRFIRVRDPYFALSQVLQRWFSEIPRPEGISPAAAIDPGATIGRNARIGAFVSIGAGAVIGDDVTIFDGSVIGAGTTIGEGSVVHSNASIRYGTIVGRNCVIHSNAVIGSDGFGFATHDGRHHKIPQIGIVRIEDDVEIGAGTTIDRGALGETVIGEGTKIDNLVQIGHNVRIGHHCLVVSQSGVAGSTEVGDYSILAGQSGLHGHLEIGSRVQVAARAQVTKSWKGPITIAGSPARPLREHLRSEALLRRLPELFERIERIERDRGIERTLETPHRDSNSE
ncbi:MAG TPA: UDP-3-O-(3-hydroxymyristoyl)glucosamine N-acyltransferase [Thermoanaerobaculia bacterium]|nr:UDP-3-O-(3-hydroxymyristoyl)glucosamine N-acyltransferase [Thermoanaerobaculia bacterium]